jgi:DNA repair photolyase
MSLNLSKGNMYEFVTHTWNTIKGECPHGCSYCYMHRFGKQNSVRFDTKELKTDLGEGTFIFVGSSCDMWAGKIPAEWIEKTLELCRKHENKYLFQTKNPARFSEYSHKIPPDSRLCTTIETNRYIPDIMHDSPRPLDRAEWMGKLQEWNYRFNTYVTIEPIMDFDLGPMVELIKRCEPVQVNIGADSGSNHLPEPSRDKVLVLIEALSKFTTVAKKRNLERLNLES